MAKINNKNQPRKLKSISDEQRIREETIINLVFRFQEGEPVAAELLSYYDNLFNAYIALICNGDYRIHSRSVRSFVKLFMANRISRNKTNEFNAPDDFYHMVNHIKYCMQDLTEEDVEHDLKAIFLRLSKNWEKREGIVFSGYISGCFHLYVKDWVKYHMTVAYKGRDREDMDTVINKVIENDSDPLNSLTPGEIDDDWVRGLTCNWPWLELTVDERDDLKLFYIDKLSRREFAAKRCYAEDNDVSNRKKYIKTKIKNIVAAARGIK